MTKKQYFTIVNPVDESVHPETIEEALQFKHPGIEVTDITQQIVGDEELQEKEDDE